MGSHSITSHTVVPLVSSVEDDLLPKIQFLLSLGFSYEEVVSTVIRSPGLFFFFLRKKTSDFIEPEGPNQPI